MDFPRPRQPREWQERTWEYWPDPLAGPWLVTIGWRLIHDRWEPIGVKVEATEPYGPGDLESHVLTAKVAREVPFGELVKTGRRKLKQSCEMIAELDEQQGHLEEAQWMRDYGRKFEARAGRPPMLSDDHYREVAAVWMEAWNTGEPTTKAVERRYTVSYPTAARWATESRNRGFLSPYSELIGPKRRESK